MNKLKFFFRDYWIALSIAGVLILLACLYLFGEAIYDRGSSWIYDRGRAQTQKELEDLREKFQTLSEENLVLKAKNKEQADLLEKSDEARSEKDRKSVALEKQKLDAKYKEIEATPPDLQLEKLCQESAIEWDFCRGILTR